MGQIHRSECTRLHCHLPPLEGTVTSALVPAARPSLPRRDFSAPRCSRAAPQSWGQLGCASARGCTGTETKILFVPGATLTYFFFFFFSSYFLFDGRLGKKRRGHLNFIHHSTPHWHHAFAIYLKWIKLIFHQQLNASAENSFFVIQICRDLGWAYNCKRRFHLEAQNIGRKVSANSSAFF